MISGKYSNPLIQKESVAFFTLSLLFLMWVTECLLRRNITLWVSPLTFPLIILFVFSGLSLLWVNPFHSSLNDWALVAIFIWFIFALPLWLSRNDFRRQARWILIFSGAILALVAFCQDNGWYADFSFLNEFACGTIFESFTQGPIFVKSELPRTRLASLIGHNTGTAAIVFFTSMITLGMFVEKNRWRWRIPLLVILLFQYYVVISAQTRGIWLATPISFLSFAFFGGFFQRKQKTLFAKKKVLAIAVVLLVALSGLVTIRSVSQAKSGNGRSVIDRLTDFSPKVLLKGSRIRIWAVSSMMVRANPLLGLGFGGFKWDYPIYQGKFFNTYPDSPFVPTDLHTDRVHNEYLQPWVELGVVGLLLIFWIFFATIRWLALVYRRVDDPGKKVELATAVAIILGALVDCFVNFEMHVVSSALCIFFALGWLTVLSRPHCRPLSFKWRKKSIPPGGRLAIFLVTLISVLLLGSFWLAPLNADHYYAYGLAWRKESARLLGSGMTRDSSLALEQAKNYFTTSLEIYPHRGLVSYELARVNLIQGEREYQNRNYSQSEKYLRQSIALARETLDEYNFRGIYYILGRAYRVLGRTEADRKYKDLSETNYWMAAFIYPQYTLAYHELGSLYYEQARQSEAIEVWKKIADYDPSYVYKYQFKDSLVYLKKGRQKLALDFLFISHSLYPQGADITALYVDTLMDDNQLDSAMVVLKQFLKKYPSNPMLSAYMTTLLLKKGQFEEALAFSEKEIVNAEIINEENWSYYHNLLLCLFVNNQMDDARILLDEISSSETDAYVQTALSTFRKNLYLAEGDINRLITLLSDLNNEQPFVEVPWVYQRFIWWNMAGGIFFP